jgi:hypothetical protein
VSGVIWRTENGILSDMRRLKPIYTSPAQITGMADTVQAVSQIEMTIRGAFIDALDVNTEWTVMSLESRLMARLSPIDVATFGIMAGGDG